MFYEKKCEKKARIKDISQRIAFTLGYVLAVVAVLYNLLIIYNKGLYSGYLLCLISLMIIFYCSVMYIRELYILPKEALVKRRDTMELAKQLHGISRDELIKLLIVENYCPEIRRVYLEDEEHIKFIGKYSMHVLDITDEGANIVSSKHDSKADIEANSIMRFLVQVNR